MVKQINIFLDDDIHKKIKDAKGEMTWNDFLIEAAENKERENKNGK